MPLDDDEMMDQPLAEADDLEPLADAGGDGAADSAPAPDSEPNLEELNEIDAEFDNASTSKN